MPRPKFAFTLGQFEEPLSPLLDRADVETRLGQPLSDIAFDELTDLATVYFQRTLILLSGGDRKRLEQCATTALTMIARQETPPQTREWAIVRRHMDLWKNARRIEGFSSADLDKNVLRILIEIYRGGYLTSFAVSEHHNWVALVHELMSWCRDHGLSESYSAGKEGQWTPPFRILLELLTSTVPDGLGRDYASGREDLVTGIESQIKAIRRALQESYPYGPSVLN